MFYKKRQIITIVLILIIVCVIFLAAFFNRDNLFQNQDWYVKSKIQFSDTTLTQEQKEQVKEALIQNRNLRSALLSSEETKIEQISFEGNCENCYDFYLSIFFENPYHNGTPNTYRLISTKGAFFDQLCEIGVTVENCEYVGPVK
jgi:uncharacterized protein YxeA